MARVQRVMFADPEMPVPASPRVAVVVPCYRVTRSIEAVIAAIGPWASAIYCVDDACPDKSGDWIAERVADARVVVVRRPVNGGVGAATMSGYQAAIADGCSVLVKIDGDGQMDPRLGPALIWPILEGDADYVKGNRFFSPRTVATMPVVRLVGNAGLSFLTKLSSGYWDLFDPTNGFTALHASVAAELPFDLVHPRYFFESDVLFRLGVLGARVVELPAQAVYGEETSHLSVVHSLLTFPGLHLRNLVKRIVYCYFVRGFSAASISLVAGLLMGGFGVAFGLLAWIGGASVGIPATAGTVMLAALPVMLGIQLLLAFVQHDVQAVPRVALHPRLARVRVMQAEET